MIVTIAGFSKSADGEYKYATINTSMENSSIISLYERDSYSFVSVKELLISG
ncbi:TPA: hypothetical protein ACKOR7_000709 [Clostridioides difficile]